MSLSVGRCCFRGNWFATPLRVPLVCGTQACRGVNRCVGDAAPCRSLLSPRIAHTHVLHMCFLASWHVTCVCGTGVGAWCRWGNALGAVSTGAAAAKPAAGAGAAAKPAAKAAPAKAAKEDSDSDDMFADSDDVRGVVADGGTHVECRVGNRSPRQYPLPPVGPWLALGCARVIFPIAPLTTVVTPLCHCEWAVSS